MYEVAWTPEAKGDLKKLEKHVARRIIHRIEQIRYTPYHFLERLVGIQAWRLRVGDYRVIMDIDEMRKTLTVHLIGHRKNVYARFV